MYRREHRLLTGASLNSRFTYVSNLASAPAFCRACISRVVLYARYSSDQQRTALIKDQLRLCRDHAMARGWDIVGTYSDQAT